MEYKRELHPLLETLGLIYLVKNFSSVRAECVQSLKEMEIDGEAFYKKICPIWKSMSMNLRRNMFRTRRRIFSLETAWNFLSPSPQS